MIVLRFKAGKEANQMTDSGVIEADIKVYITLVSALLIC